MILKTNLQICEASKKDIEYLIPLLEALFTIEVDFTFDKAKHKKGLELLIDDPKSYVIIAKFEDEVIAMITMQTIISTVTGTKVGLLEDFVVKDDYRDLGVGTHLLNYIKEFAKNNNYKRLQLVCDESNEPAKEFYTNKAFQKSNLAAWYHYIK
jgi:ribosomal protein S18 acetylase RimI-like enzyme